MNGKAPADGEGSVCRLARDERSLTPTDAEPQSADVQPIPRRLFRKIAVWKLDERKYVVVMIGPTGSVDWMSEPFRTRTVAEAQAIGASERQGVPFVGCGLAGLPDGPGRAA